MSPDRPILRFAPSPNGRLHLGHAYSALLNERLAGALGGRLLLRIEDIDVARCRPELVAGVIEDLAWLGIPFEGPVRHQSLHLSDYTARLAPLRREGLVYPCFCTRREIAERAKARDPDGAPLYPGTCRGLARPDAERRIAAGEPHALRLDMAAALARVPGPHLYVRFDPEGARESVAAAPERWGDAVLARKEIPTSYHLAVVHDDALQEITHVVRGRDLEAATDLHVLLQRLFCLPTPLYHHHGLIEDEEGRKLSKSIASRALAELRAEGATPASIRARLGFPPQPTWKPNLA